MHGKHYYFVSREEFVRLLAENAFIEHAEFSGNYYGTSFMTVKEVAGAGRRCILDIEAQVRLALHFQPTAICGQDVHVCRALGR